MSVRRSRLAPRPTTSVIAAGRYTTSSGSIDRRHDGANVRENALGRAVARDDLCQRPIPVAGELTMGGIDRSGSSSVDVDRHVANDADNLAAGPPSEHADPLSNHLIERQSRKRYLQADEKPRVSRNKGQGRRDKGEGRISRFMP